MKHPPPQTLVREAAAATVTVNAAPQLLVLLERIQFNPLTKLDAKQRCICFHSSFRKGLGLALATSGSPKLSLIIYKYAINSTSLAKSNAARKRCELVSASL